MSTTAISAVVKQTLTVTKTVTPTDTLNPPVSVPMNIASVVQSLNLTNVSTPVDATEAVQIHVPLVAGAATIDLTSIVQAGVTPNVSMSGLKIRAIQVIPDSTNTHTMSIGTGASNGYTQIGTLSNLQAGACATVSYVGATAVDGTHKNLDLVGTGTEGVSIIMVFGAL